MTEQTEKRVRGQPPWTGCVTAESQYISYSDWYWGDAECKTRCRDKRTYRIFRVTPPLPEKTGDEQYIVRSESGEYIVCYSDGTFLVELNCTVETERKYMLSFLDRMKALFLK